MSIIGHIYPWDTKAHIIWHIPKWKDRKYMFANILTMCQVIPWIPSQSCMHTGTCAKGSLGACAHKAIFYKIVDMLGEIKQAIHDALRALHIPYWVVRGSYGPWIRERALVPWSLWPHFRGKVVLFSDQALVSIELLGAIVESALKSKGWLGLLVLRASYSVIYVHAHKYTKVAFAHPCVSKNTPISRFCKGSGMPCARGMEQRQRREM